MKIIRYVSIALLAFAIVPNVASAQNKSEAVIQLSSGSSFKPSCVGRGHSCVVTDPMNGPADSCSRVES